MVKNDWEEFMGSKKRTATTHYSQGRTCEVCGKYITDGNQAGRCEECRTRKPTSESSEHKRLKGKAVKWLRVQGATKVKLEKHLVVGNQRIIADVYGEAKGRMIILECGGSQNRKLDKLINTGVFSIFIWPYGHKNPYRLYPGVKVCNRCGNCMSSDTDLETDLLGVI